MARMIPAYCPEDAPPGEKLVFESLRDDSSTDGWVVLHSLGIAEHVRQVEGEADFVVLVPGCGLIVIEIKSHKSLRVGEDGLWTMGKQRPTPKNPFQQAREAMYSIRKYLRSGRVDTGSLPIINAVWFTHVRAKSAVPPSPEWHDWQLLDIADLGSVSAAICRTLDEGKKHLSDKVKGFNRHSGRPDAKDIEKLTATLRPKFELHITKGDRQSARRGELLTFVTEQFTALDSMAENRAVLFSGPAGSGKTLIASEAARREVATGKSGRFICFNRLLGSQLETSFDGVSGVTVGTFHKQLLSIVGMQAPSTVGGNFWQEELPELALKELLEREPTDSFLVLDEVQDLCTPAYLDVLDAMVEGGLKSGRLLLFGDFDRQLIYQADEARSELTSRCLSLVFHRLSMNCRNLPRIGSAVNQLTDIEPGYQRFRRADDGVDPTFYTYDDAKSQTVHVVESIAALREEGFDLDEIVVLSTLREESLVEVCDDSWIRQVRTRMSSSCRVPGRLNYSTIHAFKGLDAPAIILTDLDDSSSSQFESLLYVGLTRATDRLVVLFESSTLKATMGGFRERI